MAGPRGHDTKADRERQISYDITSLRNLKNYANELIYKAETDFKNKFMVICFSEPDKINIKLLGYLF